MHEPVEASWCDDSLLSGYQCRTIALPLAQRALGEPDDTDLSATLVRHHRPKHRRAVMYVHGWSDYFFQTHLAEFFDAAGFDFHAVELRRYGRSLRPGQLGGFISDLDEYSQELDAALELIRADHDEVTVMGHSTGGLTAALWADQRPGELNGVILNSPWLDLQGSPLLRAVTAPVMHGLSSRYPTTVLPLADAGIYARSIHKDQQGEWDFDLDLKQHASFVVRVGWLKAIIDGHDTVSKGLAIDTPVLSMIAERSSFRRTWHEDALSADTVLDVEKLARKSVRLGPHVTVVRLAGGLHDLVLSRAEVRERMFDELDRWIRAYLR